MFQRIAQLVMEAKIAARMYQKKKKKSIPVREEGRRGIYQLYNCHISLTAELTR